MRTTIQLHYQFRWPAEVDPAQPEHVIIQVPCGPNGAAVLNLDFVKAHRLTEKEAGKAEITVLRQIAIVEDDE